MAGRVTLVLPARPSRTRKALKTGVREYLTYRITIPRRAAEELGLDGGEAALIVTLERPRWYHLLDWDDPEVARELWGKLSEAERRSLCAKNLAPKTLCGGAEPVTILARPGELERLGLDPGKPPTLEEIVKAVEERLARKPLTG